LMASFVYTIYTAHLFKSVRYIFYIIRIFHFLMFFAKIRRAVATALPLLAGEGTTEPREPKRKSGFYDDKKRDFTIFMES
jgi:hypothetical protein